MITFDFDIAVVISSLISLAGFVYLAGYWKGKVDSFMKTSQDCDSKYPPAEIGLQVKTLWDVYGLEALRGRPDLAGHKSPWRLTEKGQSLIPAPVRQQLDKVARLADHRDTASGWLAIKTLGLERVQELAKETELTTPETLGVLSIYVECQRQGGQ